MSKTLWLVCLSAVLILAICNQAAAQKITFAATQKITYATTMTSGPFPIAPTTRMVNCAVVNNDTDAGKFRVTLYKLGPSNKEQVAPFDFDLPPGGSRDVAWSSLSLGAMYEVVVEATSDEIHPSVTQFSSYEAVSFIPGTLIPAGDFVEIKVKPPKH